MVNHILKKYKNSTDEIYWDDIDSAAMLGLAKSLDSYDETKGKLSDHVSRSVDNEIKNEIRRIYRWGNDVPASFIQDEESDGLDFIEKILETMWQEAPDNLEDQCIEGERIGKLHSTIQQIIPDLNEREKDVLFKNLLAQHPVAYRALGDKHNCSAMAISRDAQRIKDKMKEILEWI